MREIGVTAPSPLVQLHDERLDGLGISLHLKRDDLIHRDLRGNKWRKLRPNLEAARRQGHTRLLTFGGAFSNHLAATAAAGRLYGFDTVGVVRGEEHRPLNDVLTGVVRHGMTLTYLDRASYRRKADPNVISGLRKRFGDFYLIPEGGSNALAVQGCTEISREIGSGFDIICCPCGTGGTLAGIAAGLTPHQRAIGFSVLKGGDFLAGEVRRLQSEAFGFMRGNWSVESEFHFGGFAKRAAALDDFIADFRQRHSLDLDWVYVAKMMYGIFSLACRGSFPDGSRLVAVVTG
ncbi:1-aminocyclopropane-1-carboxylate deaminase [Saccharothrix australiensis]|uniref:1-aminocyclopropane-1-carboxylate deaminase n=1 Tax=Saccharothrix australiensis TaxID=2072 RepID=A0A495VUU2_9PSEU|nr:1-aminocyclopropane-1-carboxylate deaminase [Saccharothrix australiensis]